MCLIHVSVGVNRANGEAQVVVWGDHHKPEMLWRDRRVELLGVDELNSGPSMQTLMEMRDAGMLSKEAMLRRLNP